MLHLRMSKSDPFHHGCNVVLVPTEGPVCPVRALKRYFGSPVDGRWLTALLLPVRSNSVERQTFFSTAIFTG